MSFGWGFTGGRDMPSRFEEQYHCYSVAYADKAHLEGGDKILLPPSAFDTLCRLQVDYPMLFRLESTQKNTLTHCGVLEFTAEEGSCYIPFWMMQNLLIEEGSVISITNASLPKATFVKLQPQHVDFLEITNPRAVLEHALRNYSCVTKGDVVCLPYNGKNYHFELKEVQPQDAACIIETDCNVDFDAPVGYKEPERNVPSKDDSVSGGSGGGGVGGGGGITDSGAMGNSITKQSAYGDRNGSCPSPTLSSMSGTSGSVLQDSNNNTETKPAGIRIVDGKVIRPDEDEESLMVGGSVSTGAPGAGGGGTIDGANTTLAEKTGATGVQPNAAIAIKAPQVDYWALQAGDGARLDGKVVTALKDKEGKEIDVRKMRAEAAARRAAAAAEARNMPQEGKTVEGEAAAIVEEEKKKPAGPVSNRKSRVGSKYSRLRQSGGFAFQGSSNSLKK